MSESVLRGAEALDESIAKRVVAFFDGTLRMHAAARAMLDVLEAHIQNPDTPAREICAIQKCLDEVHTLADEMKKDIGKYYDRVRMVHVPTKFAEDGIENATYDGVGKVRLVTDMSVSAPDKEAMYNWLHDNGHSEIITETVNAATLKALVKGRLKDGLDVPTEIFRMSPFTRAQITEK